MIKNLFKAACVFIAGLGLSLSAANADDSSVAAALKGKLIEFKDGKIQDAEIPANMEYYVLYHSASW